MIQIDLASEIEQQLATQAAANGETLADYVQSILSRQAGRAAQQPDKGAITEAIANLRVLREDSYLSGLKIKEIVHEGHKY